MKILNYRSIVFLGVFLSAASGTADDGRNIKAVKKCPASETNIAVALLEGSSTWTEERWNALEKLFECHDANFVLEKTLQKTGSESSVKQVQYYFAELGRTASYIYGQQLSLSEKKDK